MHPVKKHNLAAQIALALPFALFRVHISTPDTMILPYICITCVLIVVFQKNEHDLLLALLTQVLSLMAFCVMHLRFCELDMRFIMVQIVLPQLIMYAGFVILVVYYKSVCIVF